MSTYKSDLSGIYKLSISERQKLISRLTELDEREKSILKDFGYFSSTKLNTMIENVIGSYQLPLGIATNFKINEKDYLIPMVIEEPSVVAAASKAAKIARKNGGFTTEEVKPVMISQIQITKLKDIKIAKELILRNKSEILKIANQQDPILTKLNGGAIDIEVRELSTFRGPMLILHLLVNVLDAMGANIVNTMAEAVAPYVEELCGGKVYLRIVSNLATQRIAKCTAIFDKDLLGGSHVVDGILDAYAFAKTDPYRAATHNKGIMNGIVALTLATGNDTRAIESGAHTFAALEGKYKPLSDFEINEEGNLVGKLEMPLALGIIGGMTKVHPMARISLKILGVKSSAELSQVAISLGLAQNVAALRALVSEGIQKGHMALHARNIAKLANVPDNLIEKVTSIMIEDEIFRLDHAKNILKRLQKGENL
ncbi:MAG: hydroxymethylglutaryl-CoA reductase, degradative [Candidatus Lokiarchaeota archaeon]|nr:hydroxymethylglutaryl-CoA reductase, degradative [Candidatus Lokiarchaeota archaeon]